MNKQSNFGGGDVYQVYDTSSQDYRLNRLPEIGARVRFSDGREFVFISTAVTASILASNDAS